MYDYGVAHIFTQLYPTRRDERNENSFKCTNWQSSCTIFLFVCVCPSVHFSSCSATFFIILFPFFFSVCCHILNLNLRISFGRRIFLANHDDFCLEALCFFCIICVEKENSHSIEIHKKKFRIKQCIFPFQLNDIDKQEFAKHLLMYQWQTKSLQLEFCFGAGKICAQY